MIRVCIVCEGATEVAFVQRCLYPHLMNFGIQVQPLDMRGNVSVARLSDYVGKEFHRHDRITTLVDFYRFKRRNGRHRAELESAILDEVRKRVTSFDERFFTPYVQMHEFEALLFSDIEKFEWVFDGWNDKTRGKLLTIKDSYVSPEDINDSPQTAPSKRLEGIFGGIYSKTLHGPIIAEEIGIPAIRRQCPQFNDWMNMLEAWGTP